MLTLYSVDIKADKICQIKKKKDMLDLENEKQSFANAFECRCFRKLRKFHRSVRVSFLIKLLALNFIERDSNISYLYKGDQTETTYITKSTSLRYFAIICY